MVTRPYAQIPFVLAVTNPAYTKLGDIPRQETIGTALASLGERVFLTTMQQLPQEQRWKRLPYADPELMLARVRDGSLEGMLLWQPSLAQLMADDPERDSIHVISLDPVPTPEVLVGALISTRNSFLRNQVDSAIAALVAAGTIDQILDDLGMSGSGAD